MIKSCSNCANFLLKGKVVHVEYVEDKDYDLNAIMRTRLACERCKNTLDWGCTNKNPYWPIVGKICRNYNEDSDTC